MAQDQKQLEAAKQSARKKARRFHRLFNSPDGKEVLRDLEEECNPDVLFSIAPGETDYNVGKRDVFIYIQQLIRYEENARRTELEG